MPKFTATYTIKETVEADTQEAAQALAQKLLEDDELLTETATFTVTPAETVKSLNRNDVEQAEAEAVTQAA